MRSPREPERRAPLLGRAFWGELAVYAVLVGLYVAFVLTALDAPIARLYRGHRAVYAALALALVLLQGTGLDWLTGFLLRLFRRRR
jgi:hypothetical protein